jgi:hypothetical protein
LKNGKTIISLKVRIPKANRRKPESCIKVNYSSYRGLPFGSYWIGTFEKKIHITAFLASIMVIRYEADPRLVVVTPQKLEKGMIKKMANDSQTNKEFEA